MNYKTTQEIEAKIMALETKMAIIEANREGVTLEICETNPGRFRIARDYSKSSALNKKLSRLTR